MKLSDEAKRILHNLPELDNNKTSDILKEFSRIFNNIDEVSKTDRIKLMELWLDAHTEKYFKEVTKYDESEWESSSVHIPVHGSVQLKPEINYLLKLPIIRRCSFIKQLSTAYTIYPGAKHTRDEHQLGTLYVMKQFCDHLAEKGDLDKKLQLTLEVAALIHDVAHPPLGHSLDSIKEILIPLSPTHIHYSY